MSTKSMTAPLAIIKVQGKPVGKVKNVRITETLRLGRVTGLGRLNPSELPALEWSGTMTFGSYLIEFSEQIVPNSILRKVQTTEEYVDTVLLREEGVQVDLMRKVIDTTLANGVKVPKLKVFASVRGAFSSREGFDISEGQISGRDQDFEYTDPVIYPS